MRVRLTALEKVLVDSRRAHISPALAGGSGGCAAANQFSVAADEEAQLSPGAHHRRSVTLPGAMQQHTHQISIQNSQKYNQLHGILVQRYEYRIIHVYRL